MVSGFTLELVHVPWSLGLPLHCHDDFILFNLFFRNKSVCPVVSQSAGLSAWCSSPWHTKSFCSIFWKRTKLLRCAITRMVSLLGWHRSVCSVERLKNICRVLRWQECVTSQPVVCRSTLSLHKNPVCSCVVPREGKRSGARCAVFLAGDLLAAWSTNQCQNNMGYQARNIFMGRFWKVSVDAEILAKLRKKKKEKKKRKKKGRLEDKRICLRSVGP